LHDIVFVRPEILGATGLSCALSALEKGMNVINLERANRVDVAGNTCWTEANLLLMNRAAMC